MDQHLQDFIAHARAQNMDHATIRMLLLSAGWKEKDVLQALSAESLHMPVPFPPDRGGAREAFYHLLSFASLYISVVSLIVLFFTYLNYHFPDPALGSMADLAALSGSIHWSMAAVIVTFPVLLLVSRMLLREMRQSPEKAASTIRRWLTYITLFLAAMAMIVDVITLLFNLLQGELSVRFILKVLVVFAFAGLTFSYYFLSLRLPPEKKAGARTFHTVFAAAAGAVTLVALAWGFALTGSPVAQREQRFDEQRVEDFRIISNEISGVVYQGEPWSPDREPAQPIPPTLEDVQAQARYQQVDVLDPQTGEPYEYRVMDARRYELCAVFSAQRTQQYDIFWDHPAGRHCYRFDVTDLEGRDVKPLPVPIERF